MKLQHQYILGLCLVVTLVLNLTAPCFGSETKGAPTIERIRPEEARTKVQAGAALLVCAYEDNKCEKMLLEGPCFEANSKPNCHLFQQTRRSFSIAAEPTRLHLPVWQINTEAEATVMSGHCTVVSMPGNRRAIQFRNSST